MSFISEHPVEGKVSSSTNTHEFKHFEINSSLCPFEKNLMESLIAGLIEHSSCLIKNVTPYPMRPNIAENTLVINA